MVHAGDYSAVTQYLKAVQAAGSDDAQTVVRQLRAMPLKDMFAQNGKLREDERMVHDMFLVEVKKPAESQYPWDYYKVLATIPATRPSSPCPRAPASSSSKLEG